MRLRDQPDPDHGGRYTVKRYFSEKAASDDGTWRHVRITLKPNNPAFTAVELTTDDEDTVAVVGRLCVMASRHQISLVVITRDHLTDTLDTHLPIAGQPIGRPDACGAGHARNLSFWAALQEQDRVVDL